MRRPIVILMIVLAPLGVACEDEERGVDVELAPSNGRYLEAACPDGDREAAYLAPLASRVHSIEDCDVGWLACDEEWRVDSTMGVTLSDLRCAADDCDAVLVEGTNLIRVTSATPGRVDVEARVVRAGEIDRMVRGSVVFASGRCAADAGADR